MRSDEFNIQSGDEYANLLIGNLNAYDGFGEDLPENLMGYWEQGIRQLCNQRYSLYEKGEIDSYMLTENDMLNTYKKATLKLTGEILADLVEKGEVTMGINKDGEIVYASSDWDMIREKKMRRRKKQ
jgi:hypothetical protein